MLRKAGMRKGCAEAKAARTMEPQPPEVQWRKALPSVDKDRLGVFELEEGSYWSLRKSLWTEDAS